MDTASSRQPLPFPSVGALRRAHGSMLKRHRSGNETERPGLEEIAAFFSEVRGYGKFIAEENARSGVQGILDYWYGVLVTASRKYKDPEGLPTLEDFDPGEAAVARMEDPEPDSEVQARSAAALLAKAAAFEKSNVTDSASREGLRRVLLRLFTLTELTGEARRVQLLRSDPLLKNTVAAKLVTDLAEAGLVKAESSGAEKDGAYSLTNDALLKKWAALSLLVRERRSLRDMATGWERAGRSRSSLLDSVMPKGMPDPEDQMDMLKLAKDYVDLNPTENAFIEESGKSVSEKTQRHLSLLYRWSAALVVALAVAVAGAVWGWMESVRARTAESEEKTKSGELADEKKKLEESMKEEARQRMEAQTSAEKARLAEQEARLGGERLAAEKVALEKKVTELQSLVDGFKIIAESNRNAVEDLGELASTLPEGQRTKAASILSQITFGLDAASRSEEAAKKLVATVDSSPSSPPDPPGPEQDPADPAPQKIATLPDLGAPVTALVFSTDGAMLAGAGQTEKVRVWSSEGTPMVEGGIQGSSSGAVNCLAFNSDAGGSLLAMGSQGSTVRLYDFTTKQTRAYSGHRNVITAVAFSADGKSVISSAADPGVQIWDANTLAPVPSLPGVTSIPTWVALGVDGDVSRVVASMDGHEALVWKMGSSDPPLRLPRGAPVRRAVFSPDGKRVVTAGTGDRTVAVWDIGGSPANPASPLWSREMAKPVHQAVFSPDGLLVASASENVITISDANTGAPLRELKGHRGDIRALAYHPSAARRILLSGGIDTTARLWYDEETEARHTLPGHTRRITSLAFNRQGTQIATGGSDGNVVLWSFEPGNRPDAAPAVTGWCLYGWEDLKVPAGKPPRLRGQSLTPVSGEKGNLPAEQSIAKVDADGMMNVRDNVKPGSGGRWDQGKPVNVLRDGDQVKILKVLRDSTLLPRGAVWVKFEKLP